MKSDIGKEVNIFPETIVQTSSSCFSKCYWLSIRLNSAGDFLKGWINNS